MRLYFEYAAAAFAFLAAILWLATAFVRLPKAIEHVDAGFLNDTIPKPVDDLDRLTLGLRRQSLLNGFGAAAAAVSACAQGIAISFGF